MTRYLRARGPDGRHHRVAVDPRDYATLKGWRWHVDRDGYVYRRTSRRVPGRTNHVGCKVYLHRQLLGLEPGNPKEGNHEDMDKCNNRRSNLAPMTRRQNMRHWMKKKGKIKG